MNTVLWRRLDTEGHDACRLSRDGSEWVLNGAAVAREQSGLVSVSYRVICDARWVTKSASVFGWTESGEINLTINRDQNGTWRMNGEAIPATTGCSDIDLGFTPATNTVAIRRLDLQVGQRVDGVAAWLDDTDWSLKPLKQYYQRLGETTYEYGSPEHDYATELTVDAEGLVTTYPKFWTSV